MGLYRVGICGGEVHFVHQLKKLVGEILNELRIAYQIYTFTKAEELVHHLHKHDNSLDVVLVDVFLKPGNGVELAKWLRRQGLEIEIIFIAASKAYALEGYDVHAVHYLLKPVQKEKLIEALYRAWTYQRGYRERNLVLLKTSTGIVIPSNRIYWIEILNKNITIHMKNQDVQCTGTLVKLEEQLSTKGFIRCHKSFLVNAAYIQNIKRYTFTLQNGIQVPIGKSSYNRVQEVFINYVQKKSDI